MSRSNCEVNDPSCNNRSDRADIAAWYVSLDIPPSQTPQRPHIPGVTAVLLATDPCQRPGRQLRIDHPSMRAFQHRRLLSSMSGLTPGLRRLAVASAMSKNASMTVARRSWAVSHGLGPHGVVWPGLAEVGPPRKHPCEWNASYLAMGRTVGTSGGGAPYGRSRDGNQRTNVLPASTSENTVTRPSWDSTIWRTIARPSPVCRSPSAGPCGAAPEPVEDVWLVVLRDAWAVVGDGQPQPAVDAAGGDRDRRRASGGPRSTAGCRPRGAVRRGRRSATRSGGELRRTSARRVDAASTAKSSPASRATSDRSTSVVGECVGGAAGGCQQVLHQAGHPVGRAVDHLDGPCPARPGRRPAR